MSIVPKSDYVSPLVAMHDLHLRAAQRPLWGDDPVSEDPRYLSEQLITYIGNKRSLLPEIARAVTRVKQRLDRERLRVFDIFAGSGVVSRFFKAHASLLVSNDIEDYAAVTARCYLRNRSTVDPQLLQALVHDVNERVERCELERGFIEELYAPRDEHRITADDRVFYTRENARRLDDYRRCLERVSGDCFELLLAPLLSKASIHANTAGVFKGFYKDRITKIGRFGGTNADALSRIRRKIVLDPPIFSRFECDVEILQEDANQAARQQRDFDLAYLDPPYNQHPYGSNYFMLNLLTRYEKPTSLSRISGIPTGWKRSGYNIRSASLALMTDLVKNIQSKFLLVSFNNEGFIRPGEMAQLLRSVGRVDIMEIKYNTFRGSRNLRNRDIHVTEQLFLVERA